MVPWALLLGGLEAACRPQDDAWPGRRRTLELAGERLPEPYESLKILHRPLGRPRPGEWLAVHPEPGQSFAEYKESDPVRPGRRLRTIYIQPLGEFTGDQEKILQKATEYMGLYFSVPVEVRPRLSAANVPPEARRENLGATQILTSWVLKNLLLPRRPEDALAWLAFTSDDLWPGPGWNFVFGEASLRDRVGVWSIFRNGDPSRSEADFRLCLRRTIQTATHETGHILGMLHCVAHPCAMNGSNHRMESDARPLALCPPCLAKLCWNVGADPAARYEGLARFCEREGLREEAAFFSKALRILREVPK